MKNVTISLIVRRKTGLLHQKGPSERLCFIFDLIVCPLTATFINGPNGQSETGTHTERESLMYSQPRALLDQNVLALMDTMGGGKGMDGWVDGWMDGWMHSGMTESLFIQLE